MIRKVAIIPGEGVGPEITAEAIRVLEAVIERSALDLKLVKIDQFVSSGSSQELPFTPAQVQELGESFHAVLLGAFHDQKAPFGRAACDPIAEFSHCLDLFVRCNQVRFLNHKLSPLKSALSRDVNFAVLSYNLEGFSGGIGGAFQNARLVEVTIQSSLYSYSGIERFLRFVFDFARQHGFKKIDLCGEWRGLKFEADLWQRVLAVVLTDFVEIEVNYPSPDQLFQQMLKNPEQLEVIVTNNAYACFIADLAAEIQGGTGLAAEGYLHPGKISLFKPKHGSLQHYAGKNMVSPIAAICAAAMMLESLGYDQEAAWVYCAIKHALETDNITRDFGGRLKTQDVGKFITDQVKKGARSK